MKAVDLILVERASAKQKSGIRLALAEVPASVLGNPVSQVQESLKELILTEWAPVGSDILPFLAIFRQWLLSGLEGSGRSAEWRFVMGECVRHR